MDVMRTGLVFTNYPWAGLLVLGQIVPQAPCSSLVKDLVMVHQWACAAQMPLPALQNKMLNMFLGMVDRKGVVVVMMVGVSWRCMGRGGLGRVLHCPNNPKPQTPPCPKLHVHGALIRRRLSVECLYKAGPFWRILLGACLLLNLIYGPGSLIMAGTPSLHWYNISEA